MRTGVRADLSEHHTGYACELRHGELAGGDRRIKAFAYVGSTFLPSIFGALAGVDGYGLLPYFAISICVLMTVLFGIQKKIVETKVKTN